MDSKYNVVGNSGKNNKNGNFVLKRPPEIENKQNKKKVKSNDVDQSGSSVKVENNKSENTNDNVGASSTNGVLQKIDSIFEQRRKLPVFMCRKRLIKEIKKNESMIIIGETGSGKTTQIPQLLHEARMEGLHCIGVTQPRRVAAITVAMRVAKEMNTNLGDIVGYTVRFEDVTSEKTKVKFLTDGMLLREAIGDRLLKKYSILILDEAHERTLSTDVIFGIVKLAQKERKEGSLQPLRIIVMSATMDVDRFSKYFDDCPVIYLEGRTFPVRIYHSKQNIEDYQHATLSTVFQLHTTMPASHDFLVFLTGQEEIESIAYNIKQIAKEAKGPQIKVCPLYAGLPPSKQLEVWKPSVPGTRKIVLATNIAETSITIPNIKCVIDSGFVKERTYNSASGSEQLKVVPCKQSCAWQRAGRAGRDAPGAAYRLYTAKDMASRSQYPTPEILRCPLTSTMLWMIAIGIEPTTFPLLDTPTRESVQCALEDLKYLGAIEDEATLRLSPLGKKMSAFPIDPKYSKIILAANEYECLDEILSIVALLSSENIYHTPLHKREEAITARMKFTSQTGDHITMLNVYKAFTSTTLKKQWCKENYMNHRSLAYACEVRQQLLSICERFNMKPTSCNSNYDQILKCLSSGLWRQSARWRGGTFVTGNNIRVTIHPSSVLHTVRDTQYILIYSELLVTRRAMLTTVSLVPTHLFQEVAPSFILSR